MGRGGGEEGRTSEETRETADHDAFCGCARRMMCHMWRRHGLKLRLELWPSIVDTRLTNWTGEFGHPLQQ